MCVAFSASDPDVFESQTEHPDAKGVTTRQLITCYYINAVELPPSHGLSPAEERFLVKAARTVGVRFVNPAPKTVSSTADHHRDQVVYNPNLPEVSCISIIYCKIPSRSCRDITF